MNQSNPVVVQNLPASSGETPGGRSGQTGLFFPAVLLLAACFSVPLYHLFRFSLQSDLYSHIVLVPLISVYLVWNKKAPTPASSPAARMTGGILLFVGAVTLAVYWIAKFNGAVFPEEDSLALTTLSFVFFLGGIAAVFLDRNTLLNHAFPLGFLIFMAPLPTSVLTAVETFLQHGSAAVAYVLFKAAGTPVFHEELTFRLPGISLQVAPECSGIRSSLALFITSLLAGYLFLRTPWKYAVLAIAVIPLALVRNGFRVFTIGELCVHISPDMIDSYIHRHGGPIFFVLSLIPFFILLRWLRKSESSAPSGNSPSSPS